MPLPLLPFEASGDSDAAQAAAAKRRNDKAAIAAANNAAGEVPVPLATETPASILNPDAFHGASVKLDPPTNTAPIQPPPEIQHRSIQAEGGTFVFGGGDVDMIVNEVGAAHSNNSARVSVIRSHAENAERLTRALSRTVAQEIERLTNERRNDPATGAEIDFLTMVLAILEDIANAIHNARAATDAGEKEKNFERAEELAASLAEAGRDYAQNNYERVINYGGNTLLVALGTGLFTTLFGVSADLAFAGQFALLGLPLGKKDVGARR